jgi:hypothetical protein
MRFTNCKLRSSERENKAKTRFHITKIFTEIHWDLLNIIVIIKHTEQAELGKFNQTFETET